MDVFSSTILVIVAGVVSSLLLLLTVRRWWPRAEPGPEAAGLYGNTLGAVYGIVLAFTLAQASSAFRDAEVNAEEEANCLVSVLRIGQALPAATSDRLGRLARDYANAMITAEWPAMERREVAPAGNTLVDQLWSTINTFDPQNASQQIAKDHVITELTSFVEHRRLRQLQSRQQIPRRVWVVLVVGGLLTLANSSAARISTFRHHAGHTVLLAAMICLVLLAIADVTDPFRGANRVPPDGFRLAVETIDRLRLAK